MSRCVRLINNFIRSLLVERGLYCSRSRNEHLLSFSLAGPRQFRPRCWNYRSSQQYHHMDRWRIFLAFRELGICSPKSQSANLSSPLMRLPRKLDWMVAERTEELKTIISDNATFIQVPLLGSSTSLITVYGDDRVNTQRTIRSTMQLACQFYISPFWLLPVQFNGLWPPALNNSTVNALLKQISITFGAEIVFRRSTTTTS